MKYSACLILLNTMKTLFFLFAIICSSNLKSEQEYSKSRYKLLASGGLFINADLLPISTQGDISYKKSYIGVLGLNYDLQKKLGILNLELEGLLGKHKGEMNHSELGGVLVARIPNLILKPMSFAFGEGLSWASENPFLENRKKGWDRGSFNTENIESRPFLNYLMFELDYGIPSISLQPKVFVRIHHRSGIWGTFCPPDPPCGSNFLTYGVKVSL